MRICERPVTFTSDEKLAENERHVVDMEGIVDGDDDTAGDDSIRENYDTAGDYSMTENDEGCALPTMLSISVSPSTIGIAYENGEGAIRMLPVAEAGVKRRSNHCCTRLHEARLRDA